MDSLRPNPNRKISVSRNEKVLGEYPVHEIGSLLETGHLQEDDLCCEPGGSARIPLKDFMRKERGPGSSSGSRREGSGSKRAGRRLRRARSRNSQILLPGIFSVAVALGAYLWVGKVSGENEELKARVLRSEAANLEWKQKYQNVLFAAREVASNDLVRGRVVVRDAAGKRVVLPGIKVRLYPRQEIETFLSERYARIAEAGGTDPARLSVHFLKQLPPPIENVATDSDGRFECKVPEPGEYVIQTSIRSAQSGAMRLWFVTFDSRDPLNTPVDITESNAVQQFNPLFMLVEGR